MSIYDVILVLLILIDYNSIYSDFRNNHYQNGHGLKAQIIHMVSFVQQSITVLVQNQLVLLVFMHEHWTETGRFPCLISRNIKIYARTTNEIHVDLDRRDFRLLIGDPKRPGGAMANPVIWLKSEVILEVKICSREVVSLSKAFCLTLFSHKQQHHQCIRWRSKILWRDGKDFSFKLTFPDLKVPFLN